jgi:Asp-tRNA(Asn)/Glu-tRNA(Gln) amidotransferase C subunit
MRRLGLRNLANLRDQSVWQLTRYSSTNSDAAQLLSKPSWSVKSLLPNATSINDEDKVGAEKLNHLLRLSALPLPTTAGEKQGMLDMLNSQLHFVRQIQEVDTSGVKPLQGIRDESAEATIETKITLESIKNELDREEAYTRYNRIRRAKDTETPTESDWNVLGQTKRRVGRYFVVDTSEKDSGADPS